MAATHGWGSPGHQQVLYPKNIQKSFFISPVSEFSYKQRFRLRPISRWVDAIKPLDVFLSRRLSQTLGARGGCMEPHSWWFLLFTRAIICLLFTQAIICLIADSFVRLELNSDPTAGWGRRGSNLLTREREERRKREIQRVFFFPFPSLPHNPLLLLPCAHAREAPCRISGFTSCLSFVFSAV